MPLMKKSSQKAFEHNIKAEMQAGKPQDQSLAIAYDVKRRNAHKKKMAEGGMVKQEQAKSESRPMPETKVADAKMVAQNEHTSSAPKKPKLQHLKHDSMVNSVVIKPTRLDAYGMPIKDETHMQESDKPKKYDGMSEDKGPAEKEYMSRNMYAKGGMINDMVSMEDSEEDQVMHPEGLESDDDQESPAQSEYMDDEMRPQYAEGGIIDDMKNWMNRQKEDYQKYEDVDKGTYLDPNVSMKQRAPATTKFAKGGMIDDMDQPMDEADEEHHDSIVAAIMARRQKLAEGGMVDIDSNNEEQPNSYYKQNEEAALKENYDSDMDDVSQPEDSNEHGDASEDDQENKLDMISAIRAKMSKKQFKK